MISNVIIQGLLVLQANEGATIKSVKQLHGKGWLLPHDCSCQEEKSAESQPSYSPVLSSGKGRGCLIQWFRQTANQGPGTHFINHSYGRGWWLFQTASVNLKS